MSEQPFNAPKILGPNGEPIKAPAPAPTKCPQCGVGKDKRINSAGFGPPVIVCGQCGWWFAGEVEP